MLALILMDLLVGWVKGGKCEAWRWEWVGALGFIAFGVWYIAITWSNDMHWSAYAVLSGIPILIGILFLVGWVKRGEVWNL